MKKDSLGVFETVGFVEMTTNSFFSFPSSQFVSDLPSPTVEYLLSPNFSVNTNVGDLGRVKGLDLDAALESTRATPSSSLTSFPILEYLLSPSFSFE